MYKLLTIARGVLMCSAPLIVFGTGMLPALGAVQQSSTPKVQRAGATNSPDNSRRTDKGKIREFAPGVQIDWATQSVELDARVVLQNGPLELLACSPQTKEHESVLVVSARPLHVFQAMGLIGLQSGAPPRYDQKLDRWFPASGEPLELRIRWREADSIRTVPAAQWMIEPRTGTPPESLIWVFAGSFVHDEGGFAADSDGTVVSVVDFDSALIAPSVRHSADDEELWLAANKEQVPPLGTRCTLVVRSAYHPRLEAEIDAMGMLLFEGKSLSVEEAGRLLERDRDERTPFLYIKIHAKADADKAQKVQTELQAELRRRKLDPGASLKFRTEGESPAPQPPSNHRE